MIVTVGNTKGGVGKTTIAVNIAIARRLTGRDIWLIDADRQGTAQMAIRMRTEAGEHKDLCVVHAAALRHCECRYQQAFHQKAADAMEQARYSSAFAGLEPSTEPFNQPFRAGSPKCPTVSIIPIISRPPRECHTNLMLSKNHRSKSARFFREAGQSSDLGQRIAACG